MTETDRIAALTAGVRALAETLREEYRKAMAEYDAADIGTSSEAFAWGKFHAGLLAVQALDAVFVPLGVETGQSE